MPPAIDDPPEVNELYPDFDYNQLREAPLEWELYDVPDKTHLRNRGFHLDTFKALVKHHTWGINVVIGRRKTKERLLQVLKTIIFNHQPALRPTWHEFISRNCDAGPRLLRRSYNALQISRNFPRGVPGEPLFLNPNPAADRPLMPNSNRSPQNRHASGLAAPPAAAQIQHGAMIEGVPPTGQIYQPAAAQPTNTGYGSQWAITPGQYQSSPPSIQQAACPVTYQPNVRASPRNYRPSTSTQAPDVRALPIPDSHEPEEVSEAIEELISRYTYKPLQRHPRFCTQTPIGVPFSRHSIAGDIRTFSPITHIQASISSDHTVYRFDQGGDLYPCRGRGPVSKNNISDAVDCIIVAGIMTDAGLTRVDQGSDNNPRRTPLVLEQAYMDAIDANWNVTSDDCNAARGKFRMALSDHLNNESNRLAVLAASPGKVWDLCTASFAQFQIEYTDRKGLCSCLDLTAGCYSNVSTSIKPGFRGTDIGGVDMEVVLNRFFNQFQPTNCSQCGAFNPNGIERVFDAIPLRLAVQTDSRTVIQRHTETVEVQFLNQNGHKEKAVYRWIGGIYNTKKDSRPHFRACWSDNERQDPETRTLRFYDASQLSGVIIGGIDAPCDGERVPHTWWPERRSPFVFYERVLENDPQTLKSSLNTVVKMSDAARHGNSHPGGLPGNTANRGNQNAPNIQQSSMGQVQAPGPSSSNFTANPGLDQLLPQEATGAGDEHTGQPAETAQNNGGYGDLFDLFGIANINMQDSTSGGLFADGNQQARIDPISPGHQVSMAASGTAPTASSSSSATALSSAVIPPPEWPIPGVQPIPVPATTDPQPSDPGDAGFLDWLRAAEDITGYDATVPFEFPDTLNPSPQADRLMDPTAPQMQQHEYHDNAPPTQRGAGISPSTPANVLHTPLLGQIVPAPGPVNLSQAGTATLAPQNPPVPGYPALGDGGVSNTEDTSLASDLAWLGSYDIGSSAPANTSEPVADQRMMPDGPMGAVRRKAQNIDRQRQNSVSSSGSKHVAEDINTGGVGGREKRSRNL